jgi:hypothetical protein
MAIDQFIWAKHLTEDFSNSYPCPRCNKGRVRRGDNPVVQVQSEHSKREKSDNDWEPDWIRRSFTTILKCDKGPCGEVVAVSGVAGVDEYHDHDPDFDEIYQSQFYTWLKPVSMFPAPPLFPIAKKLPPKVKVELDLAFQLFWTDLSTSTSRLRTSLERVLDDQGVATIKPTKKGVDRRLMLSDRIDIFENTTKDADLAESMTALRIVGNLGTHGDEVKKGDYFALLDVYEDALAEIYEQKTATLKAKKMALISLKK